MSSSNIATKNGSERLHGLDALRSGAFSLVVVLHSLMPFVPGMPWMIVDDQSRAYAMPIIVIINLFCMTVFFVLSGFFARAVVQKRGTKQFLRERTIRIATPLFLMWPIAVMSLGLIAGAWSEYHGLPTPESRGGGFNTGHLWFLWVLFECCLIAAFIRTACNKINLNWSAKAANRLTKLATSPWAVLIFAIPYTITAIWQADTYSGITAPNTLVPEVSGLISYLSAFAVGWWIARSAEGISKISVHWETHLVVAVITSFFVLLLSGSLWIELPGGAWNIVLAVVSAISTWAWTYGLLGLCVNAFSEEKKWIRYMADSSYWIYIMHMPLVVGIGALLTSAPVAAEIKLLTTILGATTILIVTYDLFVRSTWIGKWLNGKKQERIIFKLPHNKRTIE